MPGVGERCSLVVGRRPVEDSLAIPDGRAPSLAGGSRTAAAIAERMLTGGLVTSASVEQTASQREKDETAPLLTVLRRAFVRAQQLK